MKGERDFSEALSIVEPLVMYDMNQQLIFPVGDEEIQAAVFQLGSIKALGPDGFSGFF